MEKYIIVRERGKCEGSGPLKNIYKPGPCRILNTKSLKLTPGEFTLQEAKEIIKDLKQWDRGNNSKPGKLRTKAANDLRLAKYHKFYGNK